MLTKSCPKAQHFTLLIYVSKPCWNSFATLTSPHTLQPASQICHETASFLPSQLHNSCANSTPHWFHLIVSKFFVSCFLPKGISYMKPPFCIFSCPLTFYILILALVISHELRMRSIPFPKLLSWWTSSALENILFAW